MDILTKTHCFFLGHKWELIERDWEYDNYPFWTETYICTRCGKTYTEY